MVLKVERALVNHSPHQQSLPDLRFELNYFNGVFFCLSGALQPRSLFTFIIKKSGQHIFFSSPLCFTEVRKSCRL